MAELRLAVELGQLLRRERERQRITQLEAAERCGVTQQAIARIESGRHASSLATIERVLAALGRQLRVDTEDLDEHLDQLITKRAAGLTNEVAITLSRLSYVRKWMAGIDYRLDGTLGAAAHGIPVRVAGFEFAIAECQLGQLAEWIMRLPGPDRWVEEKGDFFRRNPDPREPGAMRWLFQGVEIRTRLMSELPPLIQMRIRDEEVGVLSVLDLDDPDGEIQRVRKRLEATSMQS